MKSFDPTGEQRKVIEHRGSHMLVFAGPGTGKTETLARRFASIVYDDGVAAGNILVLTFSRRAADAMRERIVLRMRERSGKGIAVPELHVYTFHQFCRRMLDGGRPRGARKDLLTPVKERLLWNHVLEGCKLRTFAEDVTRSTGFATAVLNWIAQLKGSGVTPDAFASETGGDERLIDLAQLYRLMDGLRSRLGLSDFRDLVADAVRELADPRSSASAWVGSPGAFRHVLVDEFQDSDLMQLQLLEALGGETLFANPPQPEMCFVGDFNQSIYRFRGADPDNIVRAKERFSCQEFGLRLNRRSVQAVLDVANRTPRLHPESLTTAEDGRPERGGVRLLRTQTADGEIAAIADAVADRVGSGTSPRDVAVLLRVVEPYRGAIARELEARGIPVAAQSTAGYHEDSLIDAVRSCIRVVAGERDAAVWKRLLTNPVVGFRPLSISVALGTDFSGDPRRAFEARPPKGRLDWEDFSARLERCRDAGGPPFKFSPAALIEGIVRELDLLWPIRENRDVPGFDPAESPARLEALIEAAHDLRETFAKLGDPKMSASSFLEALDDVFALLGDPYEGSQAGADGVAVMSIHAAKGLEFDFVVVPQLIDGVLPARARPDQLLGARRSRFARNIEDAALEEASLWYVAVTRARLDVLATASRMDDDATEQALSPFAYLIDESDREDTTAIGRLEPAGFAKAYTAAGDAERRLTPVAHYVAARPVLGAFLRAGELIDEPPRSLSWEIERLSPSGIERYVECPRRWFYQDVLRLSDDDQDTTRMGRFVHKVLERYHQTETDFSKVAAQGRSEQSIIAALTPLAEEEARRAATECGLSTDSSMFRYEVTRVRRHLGWYATWLLDEARAEPFVVLACEQPIGIALGTFKLVGKVDRIDRLADGTLVIRDYKTGRLRTKSCGKAVAAAFEQIDPSAPGIGLFGDAPDGLKLQTLLYVRGVEALFGGRVARADYLYLAGSTSPSDGGEETCVDSVAFSENGKEGTFLNRAQLDVVYDVIAAGVAREVSEGSLHGFPTALDDSTCRYCPFTAICPGAGTMNYDDVAVALARPDAAQLSLDLSAS